MDSESRVDPCDCASDFVHLRWSHQVSLVEQDDIGARDLLLRFIHASVVPRFVELLSSAILLLSPDLENVPAVHNTNNAIQDQITHLLILPEALGYRGCGQTLQRLSLTRISKSSQLNNNPVNLVSLLSDHLLNSSDPHVLERAAQTAIRQCQHVGRSRPIVVGHLHTLRFDIGRVPEVWV